jgi:hypothetical protein
LYVMLVSVLYLKLLSLHHTRGQWRDTIPPIADVLTFRFLTADFVGETMLHCHFLRHEDLGMMDSYVVTDAATYTAIMTNGPTATPTAAPSTTTPTVTATRPTAVPSLRPTSVPSRNPTVGPSSSPTPAPTSPTAEPTVAPTLAPSQHVAPVSQSGLITGFAVAGAFVITAGTCWGG